jgi:hypothetical protein
MKRCEYIPWLAYADIDVTRHLILMELNGFDIYASDK